MSTGISVVGSETAAPSGDRRERAMNMQATLKELGDFSMEARCAAMLANHRDTIKVQKPHVAVAKLARIVDTILKLSNRQGFHATSLREISAVSGVSMGGLYAYFDSKDTLLLMILFLCKFPIRK
mgnify:FL=1